LSPELNRSVTQFFESNKSVTQFLNQDKFFLNKAMKYVLSQNYLIRCMIVDILSEIKEIKLQLKNNQQINFQNEEQTILIFSNNELNFPLQTEKDFKIMERFLINEDGTTKAVIKV